MSSLPNVLYHISPVSPEKLIDGELKPHAEKTIQGEDVNAIFAFNIPYQNNPYACKTKSGMFCFGDIVLYHDDNIEHQHECLYLKNPNYQYKISSEGFDEINRGGTTEYILRDNTIKLEDMIKIEQIEDVTDLCKNYQIFSNINGDESISRKCAQIFVNEIKNGDFKSASEKAQEYLKKQISEGNICYHNEYVKINVKDDFCKNNVKSNIRENNGLEV